MRIIFLILLLGSLMFNLFKGIEYIDPPVSDPVMIGFLKSSKYLPEKEELKREEIGPAVSKLLEEERKGYRLVTLSSVLGLAGLLGVALIKPKGPNQS